MNTTKVLNVYETFAGIGAQHKAISNIDKNKEFFNVIQTSEWDARAIMAYAQIHNKNKFERELQKVSKWSEEEINGYLNERTFSLNSKVPGKLTRKDRGFKNTLIASSIANNNYPDITRVQGEQVSGIDLLTYSFPCQGLSIANMGRDKGMNEAADSTSNLIWQIYRILEDAKSKEIELPKYLLMENVKNILSEKHKPDFDRWIDVLGGFSYTTYVFKLNAFDHGALQRRERVFAISVKDHDRKWQKGELKKLLDEEYGVALSIDERKAMYNKILSTSNDQEDELLMARPKDTPSRVKMMNENHNLHFSKRKWQKGREFTFNTLTTKQDRHPNIGMIDLPETLWEEGFLKSRFITNSEAYQIMGFTANDFRSVKPMLINGHLNKESLYRQAGNSIVVQVLESIFKFIRDLEAGDHE